MEKRLPPLNWLKAFEAASRHLSFTDAARELHMTQSAVSQQIKALENYLGRTFFIRKPRSLELTEAARAYLPSVDAAFKLLYQGTQGLLGVDHDQLLEVRANLAFTVFWLTPRLNDLFQKHPWINLNLATTIWSSGAAMPYASVEIRFDHVIAEGLAIEPLMCDELFPVCSPELAKMIKTPQDLMDHRLIDVSGIIEGWHKWFAACSVELPNDKAIDKASTYVVTLTMASHHQGIALAHNLVASDLIEQGKLVRLFDQRVSMKEHYYLIPPSRRRANAASVAFNEWLLSQMAGFREGI